MIRLTTFLLLLSGTFLAVVGSHDVLADHVGDEMLTELPTDFYLRLELFDAEGGREMPEASCQPRYETAYFAFHLKKTGLGIFQADLEILGEIEENRYRMCGSIFQSAVGFFDPSTGTVVITVSPENYVTTEPLETFALHFIEGKLGVDVDRILNPGADRGSMTTTTREIVGEGQLGKDGKNGNWRAIGIGQESWRVWVSR